MNQAMQPRVFVDGNNVMGSRADGWWRDRGGAARRIAAEIALLARSRGGVWTIVFDGPGPRDTAPSRECLTVVHAGHGGRDSIDTLTDRIRHNWIVIWIRQHTSLDSRQRTSRLETP